jgi:hypothetical protein
MDEAGAAIEQARPRLVVTYAEAGGWGRAIVLEARRRGIPSAGLQHGFIYRRWLNYLHEPDEMQPSAAMPDDRGFPRPDKTLVFDGFAAHHLRTAGAFPADALAVTGSPGLDRLAARVRGVSQAERVAVRVALGLDDGDRLAVVVSKRAQLGRWLPLLVAVADRIDAGRGATPGRGRTRLVIKPHPAETEAAYADVAGAGSALFPPASLDLATLLAAGDLVVTVNSTVAIDAMALGIPAVSVAMPNNLVPFAVSGGIAGVYDRGQLEGVLTRLLWDEAARAGLVATGRLCADEAGMRADGRAAARAAETLAHLASGG